MCTLVCLFVVFVTCFAGGFSACLHSNPAAKVRCLLEGQPQVGRTGSQDFHKYYDIVSRDGVKLHTKVHFGSSTPAKRPVILDRTPYNCESLQAEASVYVKAGFHFAGQDFRGRFGSGGQFTFWDHGSEDASDTFSFLQKQDWCNGHFFAIGTSADGIAAYIEAKQNPPLLGQFVIVGSPDIHGTSFQQGGFRQSLIEGWLTAIKEEAYIPQILAQEGYNAFWADQDITHEWSKVNWPAIHYGGWYDIFQFSTIDAFNGYQTKGGPLARGLSYLFIDPLGHCGGGQVPYPGAHDKLAVAELLAITIFKTASESMTELESRTASPTTEEKRAVFEYAVKTAHEEVKKTYDNFDKINLYIMGPSDPNARGNRWYSFADWPKYTLVTGYFLPNGSISWNTPPTQSSLKSFIYDSTKPIATLGGNNLVLKTCGSYDQRAVENGRTDVLSFTSAPVTQDFAFVGPVVANLYVASNATDTDFTVKWLDVYPDGRRMLIQDGIVRMRWRTVMNNTPSCIVPGKVYAINVSLQYTGFILNKGHSIGVSVSSSNFPRFSANPNTCQPLTSNQPSVIANNTLFMSPEYPSGLDLPVVILP